MDKILSKAVWAHTGIRTPDYMIITSAADLSTAADKLGLPLIIKPVAEGSSMGVAKVRERRALESAYQAAQRYGRVMAERCIDGSEFTCAILGAAALPVIRLETPHEFYDYEAKYVLDSTRYHCPAGLSVTDEAHVRQLALQAFHDLGGRGWGRVDIMRDHAGMFFVLELNTVPGMTDHSLMPMAARAAGLSFDDLVLAILDQTGGDL
jgi:D-alanine-D-alanine ligase